MLEMNRHVHPALKSALNNIIPFDFLEGFQEFQRQPAKIDIDALGWNPYDDREAM